MDLTKKMLSDKIEDVLAVWLVLFIGIAAPKGLSLLLFFLLSGALALLLVFWWQEKKEIKNVRHGKRRK